MKTTTILSLAILATLPFAANATDPIGPAAVPSNGTAVVATANPPYQTVTVGANDNSHIASTAYVKGAYNDAIAAVNKVDSEKQDKLESPDSDEPVYVGDAGETFARTEDYVRGAGDSALQGAYEQLATVAGVVQAVGAGTEYVETLLEDKQDKLESPNSNEPVYVGDAGETFARTDDYVRGGGDSDLQGAYEELATVAGVVQAVKAGTDYIGEYKQDKLEGGTPGEPVDVVLKQIDFMEDVSVGVMYDNNSNNNLDSYEYTNSLSSVAGVAAAIKAGINIKRVDVYTTWDSNDTTQVALSNLQQH